jgi:hypothetical protein
MNEQTTEQTTPAPVMIYAGGHQLGGDTLRRWTAAVLRKTHGRSAWARGVGEYAEELIYHLEENTDPGYIGSLSRLMLNGADNWEMYSEGGCSLIFSRQIAARLCTPSEFKKLSRKDGTMRDPNPRENWIACQARALFQAAAAIYEAWDERATETPEPEEAEEKEN